MRFIVERGDAMEGDLPVSKVVEKLGLDDAEEFELDFLEVGESIELRGWTVTRSS